MLKENRNIDLDYTDRVVRQLVDETEIDFKNSRVKLDAADYSFPFISFGGRRADAENLISEPNGNFGKYVISNYGVDETEYKEIYAMYMGVIASRLQDHDENVNHLYLHENTEFDEKEYHYATQVLDRMVKESKIDTSHEDPSQWKIHAPHMGRWISPLGFISPNNRHWTAFEDYVMEIYGLDWELVGWSWNNYRKEVNKNFRLLARKAMRDDTPPWDMQYDYLVESTEDNFLDSIVSQLVDETEIDYDNGIPHISAFPDPDFSMDISYYLNKDLSQNLFGEMFKSFWRHCRNVYGLTDPEIQKVWWEYKKEVLKKIEWKESLNESLNSRVKKEVDDLFDKDKKLKGEDKIKKYFEDKGLNKQDADEAMVQYLSKQQSLNESIETKEENHLDKVVDQIVSETMVNYRRGEIQFPFVQLQTSSPAYPIFGLRHSFPPSSTFISSFYKYCRDVYGLTEDEMEYIWEKYQINLKEILNKTLNESVDLSYSDDKDFPFLNKLANHTMSITEISRNAVMFPFIEGYISDGNFYKYFNGIPYDQLPFEATIKMDGYLKDFGLTENEKEIWWDIYVIKVIDAINERDLKIIDNYGELNESTEDMYEKIAHSVANESDIVEDRGMLFLRSPAFEGGVNVEVVLDIMSGRTKRAIPNSFIKHMKEIYNIEEKGYNTVLETVWGLYRDKMIERIKIKQAQLRQISPKQQKFFDHIIKTLVDETEVQTMKDWLPDDETYEQRVWISPPFLNHRVDAARDREVSVEWNEFSYFGYGYPSYMKDIYGLTDQEGLKLWAPYYKALQKKVEELIERDRIIYGND